MQIRETPNLRLTHARPVVYRFAHTGDFRMASRREFLQMGITALALPVAGHAAFSSTISALAGETARATFYRVVFDARYPASRAFASEAKLLGLPVRGIKGDITDLWFNDLDLRWEKGPASIAGLTTRESLFCLDLLARDRGMRVVFRADHRFLPGGGLEHTVSGPREMLRHAVTLSDNGADWGGRAADIVTRFAGKRFPSAGATIVAPQAKRGDDPDHLVSWVIAPVRPA